MLCSKSPSLAVSTAPTVAAAITLTSTASGAATPKPRGEGEQSKDIGKSSYDGQRFQASESSLSMQTFERPAFLIITIGNSHHVSHNMPFTEGFRCVKSTGKGP